MNPKTSTKGCNLIHRPRYKCMKSLYCFQGALKTNIRIFRNRTTACYQDFNIYKDLSVKGVCSEESQYSLGNNSLSRPGIYQYLCGATVCTLYCLQSTVLFQVFKVEYGITCSEYSMAQSVESTGCITVCRIQCHLQYREYCIAYSVQSTVLLTVFAVDYCLWCAE